MENLSVWCHWLMYNLVYARRDHKEMEGIERNNPSWSIHSRRVPGSISGSQMSSYREAWDGTSWFSLSEECRYKKTKNQRKSF